MPTTAGRFLRAAAVTFRGSSQSMLSWTDRVHVDERVHPRLARPDDVLDKPPNEHVSGRAGVDAGRRAPPHAVVVHVQALGQALVRMDMEVDPARRDDLSDRRQASASPTRPDLGSHGRDLSVLDRDVQDLVQLLARVDDRPALDHQVEVVLRGHSRCGGDVRCRQGCGLLSSSRLTV